MVEFSSDFCSLGRLAMLLAMTQTRELEEEIKQLIVSLNMHCCVTEVGGVENEFKKSLIRNTLGAAYANKIINKNSIDTHALMHAAVEAGRSFTSNIPFISSFKMKLAIVKNDRWICVAAFGEGGIHALSSHNRAGMGMMHLGPSDCNDEKSPM
ncbi:MAG: HutP family protein [Dehalobacterium sp.]